MSSMVQAALAYVKRHGPIEVAAAERKPSRPSPLESTAGDVVSITPTWADETELLIRLDVKPPYHIQANDAAPGLFPTTIAVGGIESAEVLSVEYPPGEERAFSFAQSPVRVYQGGETIRIRFDREPAESRILIRLYYQACDESACLPKITKQFELSSRANG
jgi:hypothetical protein